MYLIMRFQINLMQMWTMISNQLHRENSREKERTDSNLWNMNINGKSRLLERTKRSSRQKNFYPMPTPEGNRFFYVGAICHVNSIVTWLHALANYNRPRRRRRLLKLDVVPSLIDLSIHIDPMKIVPDGLWDETRPLCGRPRIRNEIRN